MSQTLVVIFPTEFSTYKIPQLASNIKKILKIKGQKFKFVKRDEGVILVDAADPVFASFAISLLFGIKKIAIAKQVSGGMQDIVSEITMTAKNLLLSGEKFLIRVDGRAGGFLPKDVEISATSNMIEKLGAQPGTEQNHDKLLYTFLTKRHAYICIFLDDGCGGVPHEPQKKTVCAVYDAVSAISCYHTIKQGYDTRIIVCYKKRSELVNLVKMISHVIPRLLQKELDVEFYNMDFKGGAIHHIIEVLLRQPEDRVSLALLPQMFPVEFIDQILHKAHDKKKTPIMPLVGVDTQLYNDAKELGINGLKLEKYKPYKHVQAGKNAVKSKTRVTVDIGPNNIHDILDSI